MTNTYENYTKIIKENNLIDLNEGKNKILNELQIFPYIEKVINDLSNGKKLINTYFDKIFIINLDGAVKRWENIKRNMSEVGITNYERYSAINGDKINIKKYVEDESMCTLCPNQFYCKLSHFNVIKMARERNYKRVLICEDDCEINKDIFYSSIKDISESKINWDIIYLHETKYRKIKKHIEKSIFELIVSMQLICYVINLESKNFETFYKYLEDSIEQNPFEDPIDDLIGYYNDDKYGKYTVRPAPARENGMESTIETTNQILKTNKLPLTNLIVFGYEKKDMDKLKYICDFLKDKKYKYALFELGELNYDKLKKLLELSEKYYLTILDVESFSLVNYDERILKKTEIINEMRKKDINAIEIIDIKTIYDSGQQNINLIRKNFERNEDEKYNIAITGKGLIKITNMF